MIELSQRVPFNGVHSLIRDVAPDKAEASSRVHGHDYQAEACIRGEIGPNGMVIDQQILYDEIANAVNGFTGVILDEIPGLGPATTENMAVRLWETLEPRLPGLIWVAVGREAHGDRAVYRGPLKE